LKLSEMSELDDMSLMRSYQAGETQALAELMRRRERWLYNVARKTIVDPSLVEDGLQEGLIQIFRSAKTFRGDSQVTSWLYQVMTRACIDVLRKEKVREHDSMPENAEELIPSESHFERQIENKLFIHGALADLDPAQREVLELLYFKELTYEEISVSAGIPVGTVKSRAARATQKLKEIVEKINLESGNFSANAYAQGSEVKNVRKLR
jgi:RNA polymerase sigma-70 factor (ECF subfamily)